MKKRTVAALLALALLLTCMLSACGGDTGSSTPATDGGNSTASTPADDGSQAESKPAESKPADDSNASDGPMTDVGTPRKETLIVEVQSGTDAPGQFNTFMQGTSTGFGIHQMIKASLWEMDTVKGEQFCDLAASFPESNEDFTEHTFKVKTGLKWSDGEDFTAEDVAYTMNLLMSENPNNTNGEYYRSTFKSVEAVDAETVKVVTNNPFPRLALRFGVTIYGNDLRIVPKHIFEKQEDPFQFKEEEPVTVTPYTVNSYDELGNWVLYERREDWEATDVGAETGKMPQAKYVLFKYLGDENTKQMLMVNNEVDIMCEVTPEMFEAMKAQNDNISAWYSQWPYATSDDPCSKGIGFSMGKGAPYDNKDFRWGLALALDFDQISLNVFDGVGRASPFSILTGTAAMHPFYYDELTEWAENELRLDLGDGTTDYAPFDPGYAERMAETMRQRGIDIPDDPAYLKDVFGVGWWKHDPEAAEKLLTKAGLEKKDDGKWYFNGEPFKMELSYLGDGSEAQQRRGAEAAYNQWLAFGLDVTLVSKSSSNWSTDGSTGAYEVASIWPTGGITEDIYSQFSGWHRDLIAPMGELSTGQGTRWDNEQASKLLDEIAQLPPADQSEECKEKSMEFVKLATEEMVFMPFHSGVKLVPTNSTYWGNYPSNDNQYNGPWWWWSVFKYMLPEISPNA